ncbi:hypothetical protein Golomagni_05486 [Golovinomyces magnicellulatus]|nr:hypothetical protein Golomagni_05486 [Golovinomyces magnicellulatus]
MSSSTTEPPVFDVEANTLTKQGHKYKEYRLPDPIRNSAIIVVGEFIGTFLFLFMAFVGAQTAVNNNDPSNPKAVLSPMSLLYIACSFGAALAANVWIFYRVTGGMFNPAVTLGLVLVGAVKPIRALMIIPTQIVASIAASAAVHGLLPGGLKIANTLGNGTTKTQGLFLEMFLTCQLVLTVYLVAVEKHRSTYLGPVAIGIAVFIAHIAGTNYTGTSVNPARSFGPAVIVGFPGYHWIYWIAPYSAAIVTAGFYQLLKYFQYESANIGQDADESKQVFKDAYGNVIGVLETMAASEFHFIKQEAQPAENEGTVVSNSSHQAGLTAAGMIKKSREEQEKAAAINLAPSEVHNQVA